MIVQGGSYRTQSWSSSVATSMYARGKVVRRRTLRKEDCSTHASQHLPIRGRAHMCCALLCEEGIQYVATTPQSTSHSMVHPSADRWAAGCARGGGARREQHGAGREGQVWPERRPEAPAGREAARSAPEGPGEGSQGPSTGARQE